MAHAAQHNLAAHTNAAHPSGGVPAYQYVAPGMFCEHIKVTAMAFEGETLEWPFFIMPHGRQNWVVAQFSDGTRVGYPNTLEGDWAMRQYVRRNMPHCPLFLGTWKEEEMGSTRVWRFHGEGGVIEAR